MLLTIFPYLVTITDGLPGIVKIGKVGNYGAQNCILIELN